MNYKFANNYNWSICTFLPKVNRLLALLIYKKSSNYSLYIHKICRLSWLFWLRLLRFHNFFYLFVTIFTGEVVPWGSGLRDLSGESLVQVDTEQGQRSHYGHSNRYHRGQVVLRLWQTEAQQKYCNTCVLDASLNGYCQRIHSILAKGLRQEPG